MSGDRPTRKSPSPAALLFTITQVAESLTVCERSVWRMIARGSLATVKCGRSVRVTKASLDRFIAEGGERE